MLKSHCSSFRSAHRYMLVVAAGAALALAPVWAGVARAEDQSGTTQPSATQPAPDPSANSTVPEGVAGNWVEGSVSPTTFWDTRTGTFVGNARGMGIYLTINPDGTYKEYIYLETRMYNMLTQVWTQHEGTITFEGDTFTIRPTKGHYKTAGTRKIDRDMTEKELAEKIATYKWQLGKDENTGSDMLHLPFDDGSGFHLRRTE